MLAAFGLANDLREQAKGKDPFYFRNSFFYSAPPFFPTHQNCTVDVTPFILYDTIVVNKSWIEGPEKKLGFRWPFVARERSSTHRGEGN